MNDAPQPPPDEAKARAAHYRTRAFEVRKRAIEVNWTGLKASFLQIAGIYDRLARQAEAAGEALAHRVEAAELDPPGKPRT
jgi:hypothetical protein